MTRPSVPSWTTHGRRQAIANGYPVGQFVSRRVTGWRKPVADTPGEGDCHPGADSDPIRVRAYIARVNLRQCGEHRGRFVHRDRGCRGAYRPRCPCGFDRQDLVRIKRKYDIYSGAVRRRRGGLRVAVARQGWSGMAWTGRYGAADQLVGPGTARFRQGLAGTAR